MPAGQPAAAPAAQSAATATPMEHTGRSEPFEPSEKIATSTHIVFILCAVMIVSFGIWASFCEIDIVSTATGEVIPSTQVKTVQHLEGGIVREIKVHEGDRVKAGQELVVLEPTASSADVGELSERLVSLRFDMARLRAHLHGESHISLPQELVDARPDLATQARNRFQAERDKHAADVKRQAALVNQRTQEINEIQTRIGNNGKRLQLIQEQVRISEGLLKRDLTNRFVHLNLLKEEQELRGGIENDRASLGRAQAALHEAQAQRDSLDSEFIQDNRKQMDEAELNFRELTQRIQKYRDNLSRTVVRAPVDGTVKTLHVVTVGGVIRPGDSVVDLVPAGDKLIVEAKLQTQDIGYVVAGQEALIKLASGEASRFSPLHGTVIQVSPDTLLTKDGHPYYKVRIATENDHFSRGKLTYNLFPGMQVAASIRTGTRTVLRYLVDPLLANLENAFGER